MEPLPTAWEPKGGPCFHGIGGGKFGFWIDHQGMVTDLNESKLATLEQIREFLAGTSDVGFTIPAEEPRLRVRIDTVQQGKTKNRIIQ